MLLRPVDAVHWRIRFLVASPPVRDLLLCAKHLFVGAIRQPSRGFRTSQSPPRQWPVARTRFKTLIYLKGFGAGACGALVSTSKFLAQMNKTQDVGRATEGCSALQSLLSWCRAGRAE